MVRVNLMSLVFKEKSSFDNESKLVYVGEIQKMKLSNGNDHQFFKTGG